MPTNDHQTGDQSSVWWRTQWLDAMAVANVKPLPRLVAYVYADHARQQRDAWVPISRLIERTGMSESSVIRSRKMLVADGWLVEIEKAGQHKAARFGLVIPDAFSPVTVTPLDQSDLSERRPSPVTVTAQTCQRDTQSISNQSPNQSLSPNQRALMQVINCEPDDERLKTADQLINSHNVRSAPAWLRSAQRNGDLDTLIEQQMTETSEPSRTTSTTEQVECKTPDCGQMLRIDRLHLPCPVCKATTKPLLKDVNAS